MVELILAYVENLSGVALFLSVLSGMGATMAFAAWFMGTADKEAANAAIAQKIAVRFSWVTIPFILFAALPSVDELWEVRLGLLKFSLASPENVQKGAEEIGRIAKKLECKYLGGCEEKPKKD